MLYMHPEVKAVSRCSERRVTRRCAYSER